MLRRQFSRPSKEGIHPRAIDELHGSARPGRETDAKDGANVGVVHAGENAFGETAGGFRRLIQIVFGLSIAFAASSFFLSFFSFGGGALV